MQHTALKTTRATALTAAGLLAAANAGAFTIIHNNGLTTDNADLPGAPAYGSNVASNGANFAVGVTGGVTGTPDIALNWVTTGNAIFDQYTSWDARGNVIQLDDAGSTDSFAIVFTPGASSAVRVISFDLDKWSNGGNVVVNWSVFGTGSGTLASGSWTEFNSLNDPSDAGGRSTLSLNVDGQVGEALTLQMLFVSGVGSYLAMDNLTFAQIPEPSSVVALAGLSALGAAALRRRRS